MTSTKKQLSPVYAILVHDLGYVPRSQANYTESDPMLWVKKRDAQRRMEKEMLIPGRSATIVTFKLVRS